MRVCYVLHHRTLANLTLELAVTDNNMIEHGEAVTKYLVELTVAALSTFGWDCEEFAREEGRVNQVFCWVDSCHALYFSQ